MDTKQEIILRYFREGDSERKISRDLHINPKIVKSYLREYIKASEDSRKSGNDEVLQEYSCSAPLYDSSGRSKRRMIKEIEDLVQEQPQENERKKREGLRKLVKPISKAKNVSSIGVRSNQTLKDNKGDCTLPFSPLLTAIIDSASST